MKLQKLMLMATLFSRNKNKCMQKHQYSQCKLSSYLLHYIDVLLDRTILKTNPTYQNQYWGYGGVVITKLLFSHQSQSSLRFSAGSNLARYASKVSHDKDLWSWFRLEIGPKTFLGANHLKKNTSRQLRICRLGVCT